MSLNNILGLHDKDYIKYIKDKSETKSHRYSYIRAHGKYHDIVYQDLWNLADKVNEDIYYKEIKKYGFNSYIEKEYIECHIWGFTRNPFLYNSLWNVWYIPRYCSYLTDFDYGGDLGVKFRNEIKKYIIRNFKKEIIEYNKYMIKNANEFSKKIKKYFASSDYIYEPKNRKKV